MRGGGTLKAPAFTLAEVLVTLGIIGIVAALTMPNLIANHQKKVLAVQAKTAYSLLAKAFVSAIEHKGESEYWTQGATSRTIFEQFLFPELKGTSSRGNRIVYENCMDYLKNNNFFSEYFEMSARAGSCFILTNGMLIFPSNASEEDRYSVSSVLVDVNGLKKPNKEGKDVFRFMIVSRTSRRGWGGSYSYGFAYGGQMRPAPTIGIYPDGYGMSEFCNSPDPRYGISMSKCIAKLMEDGWEFKDDYPWK